MSPEEDAGNIPAQFLQRIALVSHESYFHLQLLPLATKFSLLGVVSVHAIAAHRTSEHAITPRSGLEHLHFTFLHRQASIVRFKQDCLPRSYPLTRIVT
jgi:hypothetical protein